MKILYLTTAIEENIYSSLLKERKKVTNPSNENFHNKLISALKDEFEVTVFSAPSIKMDIDKCDNSFIYFPYQNKIEAFFAFKKLKKAIAKWQGDLIIFDSLSRPIGKVLRGKKDIPLCPVLTDDPANISNVKEKYIKAIHRNCDENDFAIALTPSLGDLFKIKKENVFLLEGLIRDYLPEKKEVKEPYLYFGGCLLARFGLPALLKAYQKVKPPFPLYVSGHEEKPSFPEGVTFLGQISEKEHLSFLSNCFMAINPRPFNKEIDQYSIPSKMFEYLSFSPRVASTKNSFFEKHFANSINWINEGSDEDFLNLFTKLKENPDSFIKVKKEDKERLKELYSYSSISKAIKNFFENKGLLKSSQK